MNCPDCKNASALTEQGLCANCSVALVRGIGAARKAYTQAMRDLADARCREELSMITLYERDAREAAHRVATLLGHIPVRQRDAVECMRCGASGCASAYLAGSIYKESCPSTRDIER